MKIVKCVLSLLLSLLFLQGWAQSESSLMARTKACAWLSKVHGRQIQCESQPIETGTDEEGNLIQNTWANHYEFAYQDWEHNEGSWRCETDIPALLPANGYAANDAGTTLVIMRWAQKNDVDFYIDNVTFYDKEGKSMPILKTEAAEEEGAEGAEESEGAEVEPESSEEASESAAE